MSTPLTPDEQTHTTLVGHPKRHSLTPAAIRVIAPSIAHSRFLNPPRPAPARPAPLARIPPCPPAPVWPVPAPKAARVLAASLPYACRDAAGSRERRRASASDSAPEGVGARYSPPLGPELEEGAGAETDEELRTGGAGEEEAARRWRAAGGGEREGMVGRCRRGTGGRAEGELE